MPDLNIRAEEWPAISSRLDEALALEPAQWMAWFESLDESASVKSKLRLLLVDGAGVATGDFMHALPPFAGGTLDVPPLTRLDATSPGALIGPYRLVRELGAGGMGVVWLAERVDGGLKRPVALKLPRLSWSQGLAERMGRERDILVSLDHPNIARIHDAGVDSLGRPYLALEYVEGLPIDQYCKNHGKGQGNPLTRPLAERLALLLQVARAVAHAHARLVVHRDLKPANILITRDGQVHLLDFGIAKLMDGELTQETQLTLAAGRALTPDYASPEQIRGEQIGTASDVYSLGVVAYELLAGVKPYHLKRQGAAALEGAIAVVQIPLASSANPALKGDLDAILNKALKKAVPERYATVEAFAQDIERHLARLPVLARPDSLGYRMRSFLRRHSLGVAVSGAVSLALALGVGVAIWQAREALLHAQRAERVKEFTLSIFNDADAITEAGTSRSAADLLKAARQRVNSETGGRAEVAVELMTAIGQSMVGQGLMAEAATLMGEAVELSLRQLSAQHALTSAAQVVHAEALVELGRNKEAISTLQMALESAKHNGETRTLNAGLRWLSTAHFNEGHVEEGVASASAAVASLSVQSSKGKTLTPRDTMLSHQAYADALGQADQPGAVAAARLALAAAQAIYGDKVVPSVLDIRTMLALALVSEGHVAEGLAELDTLLPATAALLGPRHSRVSKIAHLVGNAKLSAGDTQGAIVAYQHSMEVEDLIGGNNSAFDRGMARFFLGHAHAAARRPALALPLFSAAHQLLMASAGPTSPRTVRAASAHAWQLAEAGRLAESESEFKALQQAPWSGADRAGHERRLAVLRHLQGQPAEALRLAESASAVLNKNPNKNLQARGLALLGSLRLDAGATSEALQLLQQAKDLFAQAQITMSPEHAETLVALGRAQLQLGETAAAIVSITQGISFWQSFDPTHRQAGFAKLGLAQAFAAQGDSRAAAQALREAELILSKSEIQADRVALQNTKRKLAVS